MNDQGSGSGRPAVPAGAAPAADIVPAAHERGEARAAWRQGLTSGGHGG